MKFRDRYRIHDKITAARETGQKRIGRDRSCKIPELRLLAEKARRNDTGKGAKDI